ncbi:ABC transporter substrate-binding protein, partial [Acidithiobacillus thiooxidans]|uniref:ABC transporter substrate-binding protein n=1 Tax=Acidithiobacillus thiooxidans TaxID=930 RepID=UPI0008240B97
FSKIAHYSLGTAWDKLSAPEKKQFVQALTHYSVANYAAHFTHYAGQKFSKPVSKSVLGHRMMVSTTLKSDNGGKSNTFDYLLSQNHGQWKIVNVMTDGVSNLAMQKAEFTSTLKKGGIHALLNELDKHSEKLAHAAH